MVIPFAIPAAYHHLQPQAKTKPQHINSQVIHSGQGGSPKFHLPIMPQKDSIRNIDQLFYENAHHHRKVDEPYLFVCKIHNST